MKKFRFGADPVCLTACGLYALNRWGLAPSFQNPFLNGSFNDLLLIPAALPWVLWIQKNLGWRGSEFPTFVEISLHLIVWSLLSEAILPFFLPWVTADGWDVAAYAIGALSAWFCWQRISRR